MQADADERNRADDVAPQRHLCECEERENAKEDAEKQRPATNEERSPEREQQCEPAGVAVGNFAVVIEDRRMSLRRLVRAGLRRAENVRLDERGQPFVRESRSEEHTSEIQTRFG